MVSVNFKTSDFERKVADAPSLVLKNRYYEKVDALSEDGASLIARPGMRRLTTVGDGPIRGLGSESGSFDSNLFVASGKEVYRMSNELVSTSLYTNLADGVGPVRFAITGVIGTTPAYCFIADGSNLFVYMEDGYAHNSLSGSPNNGELLQIGDYYYQWTTSSLAVSNDGLTAATPYLVAFEGTDALNYENMYYAINASGEAGVDYSTGVEANPDAIAIAYSATFLEIRHGIAGTDGNAIVTTENGASTAWQNPGTLFGGGLPWFGQVMMPKTDTGSEEVGAIDVAVINSFVIVIPTQENGNQGRFYYIEPGEITIDPLNFFTAERSPDGVYGVQVCGDAFWLPGETTTEVWYVNSGYTPGSTSASGGAQMLRYQGIVVDRGSWQNASKAIHESMVVVDADGGVFSVSGGSPSRISTPAIEEQIRKAINAQKASLY